MERVKFELETLFVEEASRASPLVTRIVSRLPAGVDVRYVADGRSVALPLGAVADPFGTGKRRMVLLRRRGSFLMGCPAGSTDFACCGYLVMVLASNCPMDCSYCFLQEYVADNPGLQIYVNYADVFDELDRVSADSNGRALRIGTGELADSLAFDSLTGMARDLVEYFSRRENLLLELKTKTDDIDGLLGIDPRGRTLVSWTLSPAHVHMNSEHRTASPAVRIDAARRVLAAGYKVAFHLDPLIVYDGAEQDYARLLENLFDFIPSEQIGFISLGGLRMTPRLRAIARARFPRDRLLLGEEVLAADGRYRAIAPLRFRLYSRLREQIARANPRLPVYLCMETAGAHQRVFGDVPATPAALGARLAGV